LLQHFVMKHHRVDGVACAVKAMIHLPRSLGHRQSIQWMSSECPVD
ncbi:hypothetical protein TSMEX_008536, partial [Taenia solium]